VTDRQLLVRHSEDDLGADDVAQQTNGVVPSFGHSPRHWHAMPPDATFPAQSTIELSAQYPI
jgi:hypothetical protein